MAKSANPGQLRTKIAIMKNVTAENENGYDEETWQNIFGEGVYVGSKWVNAHGSEVLAAQQLGLTEPATITMRYSPDVTPQCIIYKHSDDKPFEIISINNVENQNKWIEIKVQRKVAAI